MKLLLFLLFTSIPFHTSFADSHKDKILALKKADTPIYNFPAAWRAPLVEWAYQIAEHWNLDRCNISLTNEIFERFIDKRAPPIANYPLYYVASFALAVKFNERDINLKKLAFYSANQFSFKDLKDAELLVCEVLRWKIFYPTPSQYIHIFFESIWESLINEPWNHEKIKYLHGLSLYHAEISSFKEKKYMMRSYQVAINNIIDAVNKTQMTDGMRKYLFKRLAYLMDT
jgi:hypothetical protein